MNEESTNGKQKRWESMSGECEFCGEHALECICNKMNWISVKDKLPEDGLHVLVFHEADLHITVGYFESENVSFYIESDGSKFYTDDGWETEIPWAQKGSVTHWMPLPEPPNKTGN